MGNDENSSRLISSHLSYLLPLSVSSRCHWPLSIIKQHVWRQSIRFGYWPSIQTPSAWIFVKILGLYFLGNWGEKNEKFKKWEMRFVTKQQQKHFPIISVPCGWSLGWRGWHGLCVYRTCVSGAGGAAVERIRKRLLHDEPRSKRDKIKIRRKKGEKRSGMNHATGTDPFDSCFHWVPRFSFYLVFSLSFVFFFFFASFRFLFWLLYSFLDN